MTTSHPPPDLAANIRAEIARSGKETAAVLALVPMASSTFHNKIRRPMTFRWGELIALARVLDVPVERFVRGGT